MKPSVFRSCISGILLPMSLLLTATGLAQSANQLTLDAAINAAVANDDWLAANQDIQQAQLEQAIADGQLPDPKMSIGLANMPTDSFSFNQEQMTQLRVGINQSFPAGNTLELQEKRRQQESEVNPYLRDDRKASMALMVSNLWFDSFLAQQSIAFINDDRALFEQLIEITSSRYTNAAGLARQQDLVRAELELIRLDDRLAMLQQLQNSNKQKLSQWLPDALIATPLSDQLPQMNTPSILLDGLADATEFFAKHPKILAHNKRIAVAETQVELSRQSLKPSYTVGASYGYRDNAPLGMERADFLSLDLSFDLPLFPQKRQGPRIRASEYTASAQQTQRMLLFKELYADYQQAMAELAILEQRHDLYADSLLGQMNDLTEATLSAYTADEGDFEEVMRAYIAELNTKIELLQIDVARLKVVARINYLLATSDY
jgi:outer membrane protein TolC